MKFFGYDGESNTGIKFLDEDDSRRWMRVMIDSFSGGAAGRGKKRLPRIFIGKITGVAGSDENGIIKILDVEE